MSSRSGLLCAISAYTLWGVMPIYWRQMSTVSDFEIIAHRMIWSCVFVIAFILIARQGRQLISLMRQPKVVASLFVATCLGTANWSIFIWAVNAGHIVEAAMGYFINPLITVVFGVLFFSERLRAMQWLAVFIVTIGVLYLVFVHGQIPLIALSLAATFSCYGLIKKTIIAPATHGLAIETGLMIIPAMLALVFFSGSTQLEFGVDAKHSLLLALGGLATLIPLLFFSAAAKAISMNALGMSQYIGPTLQLLIGIYIYHEPFDQARAIAFGFIWFALFVYTVDQIQHQTRQSRQQPSSF